MTYYRGGLRAFGRQYRGGGGLGAEPLTAPGDSYTVNPNDLQPLASGAETWGAAEWSHMVQWVAQEEARFLREHPGWTGTISVAWDAIKQVAGMPEIWGDYYQIAIRLGGAWMGDFVPSTKGSVTLEPGETQTPEGVTSTPTTTTAAPPPTTTTTTVTNGSTEGGVPVPAPAPVQPTPVLVSPTKPSGTLTPTTPSGGGGTIIDVTKPPTTKPSGGGGGTLPGDAETGPTVQAGAGSGALGWLALAAVGLALLRKR